MKRKKWFNKRGGFTPRTPWQYKTPQRTKNTPLPWAMPMKPKAKFPLVPMNPPKAYYEYTNKGKRIQPTKDTLTKPKQEPSPKPSTRTQVETEQMKRRRRVVPRVRGLRPPMQVPTMKYRRRSSSAKRVAPRSEGTTFSYYRDKPKAQQLTKKMLAQLSPPQLRYVTSSSRVTWSYSAQAVNGFPVMGRDGLTELIDNIPSFNDLTRLFVNNVTLDMLFSNQSNATAFIRIYQVYFKRDTRNTQSVLDLLNQGLTDLGAGVSMTTYGMTPFKSPSCGTFFLVTKPHLVELAAGRTHRHRSKFNYNKLLNNEMMASSPDMQHFRGWTRVVFLTMHGEPVNDLTAKTTVVPSSGAINFVFTRTYKYRRLITDKPFLEYSSSLATTGVTENIMEAQNDSPGAVEVA